MIIYTRRGAALLRPIGFSVLNPYGGIIQKRLTVRQALETQLDDINRLPAALMRWAFNGDI